MATQPRDVLSSVTSLVTTVANSFAVLLPNGYLARSATFTTITVLTVALLLISSVTTRAQSGSGNPQVPQGGTAPFPATGTQASAPGEIWDVTDPSGVVIATSSQPAGWSVTIVQSADPTATAGTAVTFLVSAPSTASISPNYTIHTAIIVPLFNPGGPTINLPPVATLSDATPWYSSNDSVSYPLIYFWKSAVFDVVPQPAAPAPDFSIVAQPSALTVPQNLQKTAKVRVVPIGGFDDAVSLSIDPSTPLPPDVTASFVPPTVKPAVGRTPAIDSTLTFTAGENAPPGSYTLKIVGSYYLLPIKPHRRTADFILTVLPNTVCDDPPPVTSVQITDASVPGGTSTTGKVTLAGPAIGGGQVVTLASALPSVVHVPATVFIGAGQIEASFNITTKRVFATTSVNVAASWHTSSTQPIVTATLDVTAPAGTPPGGGTPPPSYNSGSLTLTPAAIGMGFQMKQFAYNFGDEGDAFTAGTAFNNKGDALIIDALASRLYHLYSEVNDQDVKQSFISTTISGDFGLTTYQGHIYAGGYSAENQSRIVELDQNGIYQKTIYPSLGQPSILGVVGGIKVNPNNGHFFVANIYQGYIIEVDPDALTAGIWMSHLSEPDGIAISDDGRFVYIAEYSANRVVGYDLNTKAKILNASMPGSPDGIALGYGRLDHKLFANCQNGQVWMVDLVTGLKTLIADGGSVFADFVEPAPDGSLFLTQGETVARLIPPPGSSFGVRSQYSVTREDGIKTLTTTTSPIYQNQYLASAVSNPTTTVLNAQSALFDLFGLTGTVQAASFTRGGSIAQTSSGFFDLQWGIGSVASGPAGSSPSTYSYGRVQENAQNLPASSTYTSSWNVEEAFYPSLQAGLGGNFSLSLIDRIIANCNAFTISDTPFGGWPGVLPGNVPTLGFPVQPGDSPRNRLSLLLSPFGNPKVLPGRNLTLTTPGSDAPLNGASSVAFSDSWDIVQGASGLGRIVASSGDPKGWVVEAVSPTQAAYGGLHVSPPPNAAPGKNYEVRFHPGSSGSAAFSAVQDFGQDAQSNPSGPWRYGSVRSLDPAAAGGAFTPNPDFIATVFPGAAAWGVGSNTGSLPLIIQNTTSSTVTYNTVVQPNDLLNLQPGPSGQWSTVRFVSPRAGTYTIEGRWQGLDSASTDVHIRYINAAPGGTGASQSLYSDTVHFLNTTNPFSLTRLMAAGDTLDFIVGDGGNGYDHDSTGLAVTLSTAQSMSGFFDVEDPASEIGVQMVRAAPTLRTLVLSPGNPIFSATASTSVQGVVTLDMPAPAGGATVVVSPRYPSALSASEQTGLAVSIPAGQASASFTLTVPPVSTLTLPSRMAVTASYNGNVNLNPVLLPPGGSPPVSPTNLMAAASTTMGEGDPHVTLTWDRAAGATGYTITRSLQSGGVNSVILYRNLPAPLTSFKDISVVNGKRYYYHVAASNYYGDSPTSNEASATPYGGTVADPALLPAAGTYAELVTVDLACPTPASYMYYTVSAGGLEPDPYNGTNGTLLFSTPFPLTAQNGVPTTYVVRGKAIRDGWQNSQTVSQTFTVLSSRSKMR